MLELSLFEEIFQTTGLWGLFGPLALISISFIAIKKEKDLAIFFIIVQLLILAQYLTLLNETPALWWNALLMFLGVFVCIMQAVNK